MSAFPGMTPAAIWELRFWEWLLVADFADTWLEERRRERAEYEAAKATHRR